MKPHRNPTFEIALMLLAHPASLAALGLLIVNDQLLRNIAPSWWTGKLSDFAWLVFVPFVLAALLAWVTPAASEQRRERQAFGLAFLLVGSGFILVKLVPAVQIMTARGFAALTGAAPSLVRDPSDLLALPGLALSVWLWVRSSQDRASRREKFISARAARGLVILPLAALFLLADAAAPDYGFQCFSPKDGKIYADTGYHSYVSQDGGLNWVYYQPGAQINCSQKTTAPGGWQEVPGPGAAVIYRYRQNDEIQVSTDSGETWQAGIKLTPIPEPERQYMLKTAQGNPLIEPGPLDAIADPVTGNMLFAMGHQGVLVHTTQGKWVWSMGGDDHRLEKFPNAEAFSLLLGGMIALAVLLALLIYSALALKWTRHWLRILVLVLAALGWLLVVVIFPPAMTTGYAETITVLGLLAVSVLIVPLAIEQTVRLVRRAPNALPRLGITALLGGLLFFLPFVLWLYSTLPNFALATLFALLLAGGTLASGRLMHRTRTAA